MRKNRNNCSGFFVYKPTVELVLKGSVKQKRTHEVGFGFFSKNYITKTRRKASPQELFRKVAFIGSN